MEEAIKMLISSEGLFSVAVAAYLLVRMESKLESLTMAINDLKNTILSTKEELNEQNAGKKL